MTSKDNNLNTFSTADPYKEETLHLKICRFGVSRKTRSGKSKEFHSLEASQASGTNLRSNRFLSNVQNLPLYLLGLQKPSLPVWLNELKGE